MRTRRPRSAAVARSAFGGFCFPPDVIVLAVRWYLRFALSYRDVEELLAERGVEVDHVTIYRWVQRFTPLLAEAARPCRHGVGDRWQVDETYVKVAGHWRYVYRAIDQFGRSSTCSSPHGATRPLPTGSSSGRSARRRSPRWRSSPTRQPPTRIGSALEASSQTGCIRLGWQLEVE
jgi:DDE domain